MITLENIEITFNKGTPLEMRALRGIELAIPQGQFLTVIGSNGAGKSTLLNILAGELVPEAGRVMVDGADITRAQIHRRSSVIARLFQDPRAGICEQMSIIQNIAIASARTAPRGFGFAITKDIRERAVERLKSSRPRPGKAPQRSCCTAVRWAAPSSVAHHGNVWPCEDTAAR